jgi:hypothetical protein
MRLPLASPTLPVRSMTRILPLCLVALLASGALAPTSAASRRLALGVSMLQDRDVATYDQFKAESGRAPAVWSIWSDWGSTTTQFLPLDFMNHLKANGTVPIILWQPVNPASKWDRSYSYRTIWKTDTYDDYIKAFAQQVRSYDGRVLIRFAHEFDGSWFPWGIGKPGNSIDEFKGAWRKIFRIFRDREDGLARQARFIWSPQGSKGRTWMNQAFPGKSYVDYIGFTAFNWASYKRLEWRSLANVVSRRLKLFLDLPKKPIIITETGTHYRPHSKAKWLKDGYAAVYKNWPRIVAISYFNVDMRQTGDPKHPENWALDRPTDGSPMKAYRWLLTQTKFKGRIS